MSVNKIIVRFRREVQDSEEEKKAKANKSGY